MNLNLQQIYLSMCVCVCVCVCVCARALDIKPFDCEVSDIDLWGNVEFLSIAITPKSTLI